MFSEYVEYTEGPEDRLVKFRPTRGELAAFVQRRGQVRFMPRVGAFVPDHQDYVSYSADFFPSVYPSDDMLNAIANGRSTFNMQERVFERICTDDDFELAMGAETLIALTL